MPFQEIFLDICLWGQRERAAHSLCLPFCAVLCPHLGKSKHLWYTPAGPSESQSVNQGGLWGITQSPKDAIHSHCCLWCLIQIYARLLDPSGTSLFFFFPVGPVLLLSNNHPRTIRLVKYGGKCLSLKQPLPCTRHRIEGSITSNSC